jgi:peptidyl-prolyl cis-trans isomerase SurA
MQKVFISIFLFFSVLSVSRTQNADPVLFTVDDNPVHVSEFLYIYQKNNGAKADFSEESLREYLDLYTRFKLKVNKARQMQLDTIPELISELAGYRKQLSKSYLVDKEVNQKLVEEVFERRKRDLNVSHILIVSRNDADVEQDAEAKARIWLIYDKLQKGEKFGELANEYSEDKSSSISGGNLGYITAMLPDGFYNFENAIYKLEPGQYSQPFKTDYGYHIAKLNGVRPARGTIEAAHIMIKRKTGQNPQEARNLIDSLHERLLAGDPFEALAKKYSMDKMTSVKGGYIGVFGINKYDQYFEDEVFKLNNDGDFSKPFMTSAGWHIVKRISKPDLNDFDKAKRSIAAEITKDSRFSIAKKALIEKIRTEAGFREDTAALNHFARQLDGSFFTLYWTKPDSLNKKLFSLGNQEFSLEDFAVYCSNMQRERIRYGRNTDINLVVQKMYDDFVGESCMTYEEEKLEDKYPDFRSLMREYDEGILLFEATKREVWDKASQDTAGLKDFYEDNKQNYLWRPRADLYTYTLHTNDEQLANKVYKFAGNRSHGKIIEKFNAENQIISFSRNKVENGSKELAGMNWAENALSTLHLNKDKNTYEFKKIAALLPKTPKSLDEARGYVIADYQEHLEKNWVESLKTEFNVEVNWNVFNDLVKK